MAVWCSNADAKQQRDTHRALNPICCHLRPGQVLNALYTFASTRVLVQGCKHLIARASAYAPVIKPSNLSRLAKWSPIRPIPCTAPSDGAATCEGNQACSGSAQGLIWMARTSPQVLHRLHAKGQTNRGLHGSRELLTVPQMNCP